MCIYSDIIMDDEQTVGGLLKSNRGTNEWKEMSAAAVAVVSAERVEDNIAVACSACSRLL